MCHYKKKIPIVVVPVPGIDRRRLPARVEWRWISGGKKDVGEERPRQEKATDVGRRSKSGGEGEGRRFARTADGGLGFICRANRK